MLIKTLPVGQLETNCYVVTDEKSLICAVIDPGDESNTILDYLEDNHLRCTHILITHGHYDHTMAVSAVKEATGAEVYMNEKDAHADLQSASLKYNPPAGTSRSWRPRATAPGASASSVRTPSSPGTPYSRGAAAAQTFRGAPPTPCSAP